jgi:hypothetical protein
MPRFRAAFLGVAAGGLLAACGSSPDAVVAAPAPTTAAATTTASTPAPTTTPPDVTARGELGGARKTTPAPSRTAKPAAKRSGACAGAPDTPGGADPWGGCFPGPGNTGVPRGVTLTPYTGPCDIKQNNVTIDAKLITCPGILVYGSNLTIKRSKLVGIVKTNVKSASMRIEDSEIDGGSDQSEAVGVDNVTVVRSNIYGNQHSVHCGDNCTVTDSWLHDQHDGKAADWHQNAFLTNGGAHHTLRHNSLGCTGGCTAAVGLIPDGDISQVVVDRNLILASPDAAYCVYGGGNSGNKPGKASYVTYTDNVFQRGTRGKGCAAFGPVTYFDVRSAGNRWSGNTWNTGGAVDPEN